MSTKFDAEVQELRALWDEYKRLNPTRPLNELAKQIINGEITFTAEEKAEHERYIEQVNRDLESGDVECGKIGGSVKTMSGDVTTR